MKIEKKTIVIIVIVAVAAFLLWKRYKGNRAQASDVGTSADTDTTGTSGNVSLDYILTHINFNTEERKKIEEVRNSIENSTMWHQSVEAQAYQNGISFDQQLVCSALWLLYNKNGKWINDRGWRLSSETKKL